MPLSGYILIIFILSKLSAFCEDRVNQHRHSIMFVFATMMIQFLALYSYQVGHHCFYLHSGFTLVLDMTGLAAEQLIPQNHAKCEESGPFGPNITVLSKFNT
mgnify:CR=1 FL=1